MRWSATKAAVALGDLGMNVTSGRPSAFVGGAARDLAHSGEVLAVTAQRVIASGQTACAAASTTDLTTFTRNASERVTAALFVTNNTAGITFAVDRGGLAGGLTEGIGAFFERTGAADEAKLRARNSNAASSRTVDWMVIGYVP